MRTKHLGRCAIAVVLVGFTAHSASAQLKVTGKSGVLLGDGASRASDKKVVTPVKDAGSSTKASTTSKTEVKVPMIDTTKIVKPAVVKPTVVNPVIVTPLVNKKADKKDFDVGVVKKVDPKLLTPTIVTKPTTLDVKKLATSPALKLPGDVKFDAGTLAKIKPPIDLTKIKADKVLGAKPPVDFKIKPLALDKIVLPKDAPVLDKLNAKLLLGDKGLLGKEKFLLNKAFCMTGDYHLHFGVKCGFGYCYPGVHHCHWHHCIWDPCFGCHYYYDPCVCCYYYWCETDVCYYPCWWFVEAGSCYYPWWLCGGFGDFGYHHGGLGIHVHIGW